MASAMPGVAPAHLLVDEAHEEAGRVGEALGDEVEGVQPVPGCLLDDRPGRLFPLVPLRAGGTDHVLRELVDPLDDLKLIFVQLERVVGHVAPSLRDPGHGRTRLRSLEPTPGRDSVAARRPSRSLVTTQ